jgi:hypothetical protein
MAEVALTRIVHGEEDGSRTVIEEGGSVKDLPKDVVDELREAGAVGTPPAAASGLADERDALQARVAELEAQLAEAKGDGAKTPPAAEKK